MPAAASEERAELDRRLARAPAASGDGGPGRPQAAPPAAAAGDAALEPRVTEKVQLSVDGAVQATRYAFDPPRDERLLVGASSFRITPTSEEDAWRIHPDGFGYVLSTPDGIASVNLVAPLGQLPRNATVRSLWCYWLEGRSDQHAEMSLDLRRHYLLESSSELVASVSVTTDDGDPTRVRGSKAATIHEPDVGHLAYEYFLEGVWEQGVTGTGLRFYGCEIGLLMPELDP